MPNTPIQVPNVDLPGAEYFALAPQRSVALGGRRRRTQTLQGVFAASTTGNTFGQLKIEDPFPLTAGIYIHYLSLAWSPQDNSGQVSIGQASTGFGMAAPGGTPPTFVGLPIGIPTQTNVNPIATQNILTDRDILLNGADIMLAASSAPGSLWWQLALGGHNSDAGGPHTVILVGFLIYTRLDGFLE